MSETNTSNLDSAVRVVVSPSQSSYFAGELFSATITFTNSRSPDSTPQRIHSHTRAAHSISSAPLSRPPTSPGTPRTPVQVPSAPAFGGTHNPSRKGLIGRHLPSNELNNLTQSVDQRRKKLQPRSLSVSIAPHNLENQSPDDPHPGSAPPRHTAISCNSPTSPVGRSTTLPLSPNHPHARKISVLDGSLQLHEMSNSLPPSPYALSASTSSFSLVLDPIAENAAQLHPPSPLSASPISDPPLPPPFSRSLQPKHGRRPLPIGLGQPSGVSKSNVLRTAFSSSLPQSNTELILYSYAQLTGTVIITPPPGISPSQAQLDTLHNVRSSLIKRSAVGGGSMDITLSLHHSHQHPRRHTHTRSASLSSGLLSLLSPSSLITSVSTPSATPTSSAFSGLLSPSPSADGGSDKVGLGIFVQDEINPETPLPTFQVQPTMLAVDLCLLPGESRSFTYSLPLPDNLPPTFKGRSMKFSYELVVGTCRAGSPASGGMKSTGANSTSRVMKVPIRVYNNVVVGQPPKVYDLLWPVSRRLKLATDPTAKVVEEPKKPEKSVNQSPGQSSGGSFRELQDYARRLSTAFLEPAANGVRVKPPFGPVLGETEHDCDREQEGALTGCREAVELLTRNPRKASYDVNKGGVKVAILTFTKSAYRLGETALGVVELNERTSRARVLQLSAILECQESLPSSLSPTSNSRQMRRVHAEYHSSFVLSNLRTTFSLDIPSDASPAFQVKVGGGEGDADSIGSRPGGLEWKVRLCLLVAVAMEASVVSSEGVRLKSLIRDGPKGHWGSSWKATSRMSPMERLDVRQRPRNGGTQKRASSWTSFLAASLLGVAEDEEEKMADGDGDDDSEYDGVRVSKEGGVGEGVKFGGGREGWEDVRLETVECEVPIKVWPGNTAFKAVEVVFHV